MEIGSGAFMSLTLGFLLGLKHATDADHVVAVSTIVSEYRNAWRGVWVGASWGLGHSTPLLVLGVTILLLKEAVLDQYQQVSPILEFGVAIMLVLLGVQVFWNLKRGRLHVHEHSHDDATHLHIHSTHDQATDVGIEPPHRFFTPGKPFFRPKSYLIGIVHGLAGSAAVMLVLLPEIELFWVGIGYLFLFGIGTMFSMAAVTFVLGIPFAIGGRFERVNRTIAAVAGTASLVFGFALMAEIGLDISLIPF